MRALLDVNMLIALLDADHIHHVRATQWLEGEISHGWASCPLTQNGCIRIMSQPAYPNPLPPAAVAQRLSQAAANPAHAFVPGDCSLLEPDWIRWQHVLGHRQITDSYLLGLAVHHDCRLVGFDRRIDLDIVAGAQPCHWVAI